MTKNNKEIVKIFLSYHRDTVRLHNQILTPIHVGRAIAAPSTFESLADIIGDDTGDNISTKNKTYCELTAQYWAWKNCDADYIGFMHYRRHLCFNTQKKFSENQFGVVVYEHINPEYIRQNFLDETSIYNLATTSDVLIAKKWDVTSVGSQNNFDHYSRSDSKLHVNDYQKALQILLEKFPDFASDVDAYNNATTGFYTNMFVMKKEIFADYNEWLFTILFALEKQLDISHYDQQEARVFGYISEWLLGIYIYHLLRTTNYKITQLQRTFVNQIDKINDLNIAVTANDAYVPHLKVFLASVLQNKNENDRLHFWLLQSDISASSRQEIAKLSQFGDFTIDYVDINEQDFAICPWQDVPTMPHASIVNYYRLILASALPHLDKVLFMDADIIVKSTLAGLYQQDLGNNYFLGVVDILLQPNTKRLHLKKYANAGVMLVNLQKWRQDQVEEKFFRFIKKHAHQLAYLDQDVLNSVLQEGISYLPLRYNAQVGPSPDAAKYNEIAARTPVVIHFAGDIKPWDEAGAQFPFAQEYQACAAQVNGKGDYYRWWWKNIVMKKITTTIKQTVKSLWAKISVNYRYHNYNLELNKQIFYKLQYLERQLGSIQADLDLVKQHLGLGETDLEEVGED